MNAEIEWQIGAPVVVDVKRESTRVSRFGERGASPAVSRASRDTLNENCCLQAANPASHSNLPAQRLRLDHYDGRRAIR